MLIFPIALDLAMRVARFSLYQLIFGPYFTFQGQAKDRIVDSAIVLAHYIPLGHECWDFGRLLSAEVTVAGLFGLEEQPTP